MPMYTFWKPPPTEFRGNKGRRGLKLKLETFAKYAKVQVEEYKLKICTKLVICVSYYGYYGGGIVWVYRGAEQFQHVANNF